MAEPSTFAGLMGKVRAGDAQAAEELVRQFEPQIRRRIRVQMNGTSVQRFLDSGDIFQSVAAQFFVKVTAGDFVLNHPAQLAALLMTMAHNKLVDKLRHEKGANLAEDYSAALAQLPAKDATPSRQVALKDLFGKVMAKLAPEERAIAELRFTQGLEWGEIFAILGGASKDALRRCLKRALDRVLEEMGLGGVDLT